MAISIDRVYQKVLAFANKEQRGYITPQEFNLFAHQAQMEIFEQYFYDVNQWSRQHGSSIGYADMVENLQEKIARFEFHTVGDNITVLNRWGDVNLENDIPNLYRLGSVYVKYPENKNYVEAELIDNMREYELLSRSKLTKRSRTRPQYFRYHNGYDRIKIYPYPVQDDGGIIDLQTNERDDRVKNVNVDSVVHINDITQQGKYMFFNEADMIDLLGTDYINNDVFTVKVFRTVNGVDALVYDGEMEFFDSGSPTLLAQFGQFGGISSARKYPQVIPGSTYDPLNPDADKNPQYGDWEVNDTVYVTTNIFLGNQRNVRVNYVKKPTTPNWNYTVINEKPLYNATSSVDFELHDAEESELVYRILTFAGIAIEKQQLAQLGQGLNTMQIQQEKQ